MVFSPFNVAVSNRSFCLSAFGWFLKTTTTLPRAPGSQLPPRTPSPPRRTRHAMSHPVTADDPEAIRITPGFLRHELTKWDRGEPTAPKQRPSYFWAPQETSLKPPRRAGANHPTFQLTLTREEIDDDFAEINRALRGDPAHGDFSEIESDVGSAVEQQGAGAQNPLVHVASMLAKLDANSPLLVNCKRTLCQLLATSERFLLQGVLASLHKLSASPLVLTHCQVYTLEGIEGIEKEN